jgi:proteasome beta subunit
MNLSNRLEEKIEQIDDRETDISTGTTIVGIKAQNGCILAADKQVTGPLGISSKSFDKIEQIHTNGGMCSCGSVAAAQNIVELIDILKLDYKQRRNKEISMSEIMNYIQYITRIAPLRVSMIFGKSDGIYNISRGSKLCEDFHAAGSGGRTAIGVIESEYQDDIKLDGAEELAISAVRSSRERDLFTGFGTDILRITEQDIVQKTVDD